MCFALLTGFIATTSSSSCWNQSPHESNWAAIGANSSSTSPFSHDSLLIEVFQPLIDGAPLLLQLALKSLLELLRLPHDFPCIPLPLARLCDRRRLDEAERLNSEVLWAVIVDVGSSPTDLSSARAICHAMPDL
jgi:hypothetical protein